MNVLALMSITAMIVLQIWRIVKANTGLECLLPLFTLNAPRNRLQTLLQIVIESGLMYTITSFTVFVTLVSGSNSIFITSAVVSFICPSLTVNLDADILNFKDMQVTGIAFNLILIRVAKNANEVTTGVGNVSTTISFARSSPAMTGSDMNLREINEHGPSQNNKIRDSRGIELIEDIQLKRREHDSEGVLK